MNDYKAPLKDMKFLIDSGSSENTEVMAAVLDEAARFVESVVAPANGPGDRLGCRFESGDVYLPQPTRDAFKQYVAGGWVGISLPEQFGGQGLPDSVASKVSEMLTSTNNALCMIPALTMSACKALLSFGSDELKNTYLPKLVSGTWTGTMCLTEPHCGSDLGLIKARAQRSEGDRFLISGTKIFISAGEHDGSENIIHLVLARIQGAPDGIRGLSLFLVPKYLEPLDECPQRNPVHCIGIEEKMGIHANPTCTMSFESAEGYLVGKENEGIKAMFKMMNEMRLGTALQGVGLSEHSFQKSYHYATERRQGQALDRSKRSSQSADALINHADIKRMLLTQKAFAEGGRAFCHFCAELIDRERFANDTDTDQEATLLLGLLTPIAKAFLTETGLESATNAIQVYGGHGYIKENEVEQLYRDGRIATLYEGTTGIQALDLLGRKVLGDQAKALLLFTKKIHKLCNSILDDSSSSKELVSLAEAMAPYSKEWPQLAQQVGMKALQDHDEVGAAAYDFLMYSGYVTLGYFWLYSALKAYQQSSELDSQLVASKLKTANFYVARLLPRTSTHRTSLLSGKANLDSLGEDEWILS